MLKKLFNCFSSFKLNFEKRYFITSDILENLYTDRSIVILKIHDRKDFILPGFIYLLCGYVFFNNIPIGDLAFVSTWSDFIPWIRELFGIFIRWDSSNFFLFLYVLGFLIFLIVACLSTLFASLKFSVFVSSLDISILKKLQQNYKILKIKDNNILEIKTLKPLTPQGYKNHILLHKENLSDAVDELME